ncbi:MAG: hypothetical protein L7V87_13555 [Verrucomicrobiales bacterium]|jgi:hypothetical protein|nr:hypothetical protein [Verrucomicrobiales bacterium]
MTTNRFLQTFVLAAALLTPLHSYSQENENPNQKRVEEVTEPAPVSGVKANIVPLIWRVTIGEAVVSVPLRSIEYYGVQIYDTDSQTRVRELTICTESQSLVRIYYIQPLGTANERLAEKAERLRQIAQGATKQKWAYPFKQYPTTTHTHMVEYRVGEKETVSQLFTHLEAAMIEYHARDLVPEQRPQIIREIEVKEED